MKTKTRWVFGLLIGVLLAFLIGRLVWTSWGTVTGWGHVKNSLTQATYGWMTPETSAIRSADPDAQADFWLKEIDRVIKENPDSAEIAMGCALILDSHGSLTLAESFSQYPTIYSQFPNFGFSKFYRDDVKPVLARFQERTNARCLELAKRATDLEPKNKTWWRLRALLLFPEGFYRENNSVRTEERQRVLEEAAKHDPENALYEYLAASFLWENNTDYVYDTLDEFDDWTVLIKDRKKMDSGLKHFRAGLQKKFVNFGENGLSSMATAIEKTNVNPIDHLRVTANQWVTSRSLMTYTKLQ